MSKRLAALVALFVATVAIAGGAGHATAQDRVKAYIGSLSCNVSGSVGLIFGSTKELSCAFLTIQGTSESYTGSIDKFGIDIGYTKPVHMVWHVYSLGSDRGAGVLGGKFLGSQGSVSLGTGAGGNLLVGGRNNEIVLQSAGIRANAGYNFADGVAELSLTPAQ